MTTLPSLELRLQKRYQRLVRESLHISSALAPGVRSLPGNGTAFASTQAAWRFYANPDVGRVALAEPLIACARVMAGSELDAYGLVVHDWSQLNYGAHTSKRDRKRVCSKGTLGYELETSLLVSDRDGGALAPLHQSLWSADGVYTTRTHEVLAERPFLDEVTEAMAAIDAQGLSKPLVHIIDRGGDSVGHYRRWARAGRRFLVRADEAPRVAVDGTQVALRTVGATLDLRPGAVLELSAGVVAQQFVAETDVTITRPARPYRQKDGVIAPRKAEPGEPITLRLIVSEVRTPDEEVVAQWYLLTNVEGVEAERIAQWYCWRWKIESYFKVMKSGGHALEHWQQSGAEAILKRLLVTSMGSVLVWQLMRATSREAELTRQLLVRMSGRQMRRNTPATEPALLAGLWVLLSTLDALEQYSIDDLKQMARVALAGFSTAEASPPKRRPASRRKEEL